MATGLAAGATLVVAVDPGGSRREVHVSRTNGEVPLVCAQLRSPVAISAAHTGEVVVSLNQWNARHRTPRAWSLPRGDGTLVVALEAALPAVLADDRTLGRLLDAVVDGGAAFWDWVDTTRSW
jgi:hypothetical protein